jgi:hypothetical protein
MTYFLRLRTVTIIIALFERSLSFEVNTKSTPFFIFSVIYIISLFQIFIEKSLTWRRLQVIHFCQTYGGVNEVPFPRKCARVDETGYQIA